MNNVVKLMENITVIYDGDLVLAGLLSRLNRKGYRALAAKYRTELGRAIVMAADTYKRRMDALPKKPIPDEK